MQQLLFLSLSDFKLVFRDPSLRTFLFLPVLIFIVILVALPALINSFPVVEDYTLYVLMAAVTQTSQMFGFIYGMVFIEEKETQVAKMYGVVPVERKSFILSRLVLPSIFSIFVCWLLFLLQPFVEISLFAGFVLSVLMGLIGLAYPLAVSMLSSNKMMGMTMIKIMNLVLIIPLVGFFTPKAFAHIAFGIIPSHWLFHGMEAEVIGGNFGLMVLIGFILTFALIVMLIRRFVRTHYA